jgi:hypothetical protein
MQWCSGYSTQVSNKDPRVSISSTHVRASRALCSSGEGFSYGGAEAGLADRTDSQSLLGNSGRWRRHVRPIAFEWVAERLPGIWASAVHSQV